MPSPSSKCRKTATITNSPGSITMRSINASCSTCWSGPAETVNISGRKALLVLQPDTRKSFWAAQRPDLSLAKYIFPLPPAGTTMFLNSALTRMVGTQNFTQPFGGWRLSCAPPNRNTPK